MEEKKPVERNFRKICPVQMAGFEIKGAKFEPSVVEEVFNCEKMETSETEIKAEIDRYNAKGPQAVKTFLGPIRELTAEDKKKYSALPKISQ